MKLFAIIFFAILAAAAVIGGVMQMRARAAEREATVLKQLATLEDYERMIDQWVAMGGVDRRETPKCIEQIEGIAKSMDFYRASDDARVKEKAERVAAQAKEEAQGLRDRLAAGGTKPKK